MGIFSVFGFKTEKFSLLKKAAKQPIFLQKKIHLIANCETLVFNTNGPCKSVEGVGCEWSKVQCKHHKDTASERFLEGLEGLNILESVRSQNLIPMQGP